MNDIRSHDANERTFLAWIRTAISLMSFGFLIEKFQIFVQIQSVANHLSATPEADLFARTTGILMMLAGILFVPISTWGYFRNRRLLRAGNEGDIERGTVWRNFSLAIVLILLSLVLMIYVILSVLH